MSETQTIRKILPNLMSHLVKDLTTAERERNARKELVTQINEITTAAQIGSNRKIGTLTQGTTLDMTITTLPETIPPTTLITPLPETDLILKNVIITAMIETLPMSVTLVAILHITIMVEIVLRHLTLTPSKEIPL
jgi:hypothetical protein